MSADKLAGLHANVTAGRTDLKDTWSRKIEGKEVSTRCQIKWDSWSTAVRSDYLRRAQAAVIAGVQTNIPRKQWAQWEVTLRFCLDDIFARARATSPEKFGDKEHGLRSLLEMVIEGQENERNPEEFDKKIVEMLEEMKTNKVAGFDSADTTHGPTLRAIRSIYAIQWARYLMVKLSDI